MASCRRRRRDRRLAGDGLWDAPVLVLRVWAPGRAEEGVVRGEGGHFLVEVLGEAGLARHDGDSGRWLGRCPIGRVARGKVSVGDCGVGER